MEVNIIQKFDDGIPLLFFIIQLNCKLSAFLFGLAVKLSKKSFLSIFYVQHKMVLANSPHIKIIDMLHKTMSIKNLILHV